MKNNHESGLNVRRFEIIKEIGNDLTQTLNISLKMNIENMNFDKNEKIDIYLSSPQIFYMNFVNDFFENYLCGDRARILLKIRENFCMFFDEMIKKHGSDNTENENE